MTIIAIDGPVASGKTTVGRSLSTRMGVEFLDTGIMYRAATRMALMVGINIEDEEAVARLTERFPVYLNLQGEPCQDGVVLGEELTSDEVVSHVSAVSAMSKVRVSLVQNQRRIARLLGNIVMVGRDIGTVVLPNANLKVYLTASPVIRAHRRWIEQGRPSFFDLAVKETARRDEIDSTRADSPLKPAEDAWILDTTNMSIDEVIEAILASI